MRKRNLLLINESQRGTLYPFPANFPLPPSVEVGEQNTKFYQTNRVKTLNGEVCPVYVENAMTVNLDEVADPVGESPSVPENEPTKEYVDKQGTGYPVAPNPAPVSPLAKNADEQVKEELAEIIASTDDYEELYNAVVKWHNNNLLNRL